ncbi:MAG: hypothetical protein LBO73_02325 [Holosporaceae bacterium]|nr:hypothetical protein [Holosporaceae bacterium]
MRIKTLKDFDKINDILLNGGDISTINKESQREWFKDQVKARTAELAGQTSVTGEKKRLTSTDKALIAMKLTVHVPELLTELKSKMSQGTYQEAYDACVAMKMLTSENENVLGEKINIGAGYQLRRKTPSFMAGI